MTQLGLEDLPTLLAAAKVCKRLIKAMDIQRVRRQKLDKLVAVLGGVRQKTRTAKELLAEAQAQGATHGVMVLAFEPQEWWAIWHSLMCLDQVMQPKHDYTSDMKPKTFKRRRKLLTSLLARVHSVLHSPQMPHRCTCQDEAKNQKPDPKEAFRWN